MRKAVQPSSLTNSTKITQGYPNVTVTEEEALEILNPPSRSKITFHNKSYPCLRVLCKQIRFHIEMDDGQRTASIVSCYVDNNDSELLLSTETMAEPACKSPNLLYMHTYTYIIQN